MKFASKKAYISKNKMKNESKGTKLNSKQSSLYVFSKLCIENRLFLEWFWM